MPLIDEVRGFFHEAGLAHTRGVVALSGGPDSVALAHILVRLLRDGFFTQLCLAHVNHQLRGDESDADEIFVQKIAESWGKGAKNLRCRTTRIDVAAAVRATGDNLEKTARELRYRWLEKIVREDGADWLATGHSADDQAETVLHRLLRGAGLQGLTAILPRRRLTESADIVRPVLTVRRGDILAYLREQGLFSRQDSSNLDAKFTRNQIRMHLLPILAENYQPAIVDVLCRLADQARGIQAEIVILAKDLLARAELPRVGPVLIFRTDILETASPHMVCEMFRLVWQREAWPMDAMDHGAWLRLAELARTGGGGQDFPGMIRVERRGHVLRIEKRGHCQE